MLQSIGTYVDPTVLVQKIKLGLEIPGLKNSLVKMLRSYNLQVSVQEGCKKILVSDYFNLHKKLVHVQQRGMSIHEEVLCGKCYRKIIVKDIGKTSTVIIYNCKHCFHEQCLPDSVELNTCGICYPVKQK